MTVNIVVEKASNGHLILGIGGGEQDSRGFFDVGARVHAFADESNADPPETANATWQWENPSDPPEEATLSPSVEIPAGGSDSEKTYVHGWVRNGEFEHAANCRCGSCGR